MITRDLPCIYTGQRRLPEGPGTEGLIFNVFSFENNRSFVTVTARFKFSNLENCRERDKPSESLKRSCSGLRWFVPEAATG